MTKSQSSGTSGLKQDKGASNGLPTPATRIDPPHEITSATPEPLAVERSAPTAPEPVAAAPEQIRLQADQLASHLMARQKELDHREAAMNSQAARLESDARAARIWLSQREADLADRDESLLAREDKIDRQLKDMQVGDANPETVASASPAEKEGELSRMAEALAAQKKRLDEAEQRLSATQTEAERFHKQLSQQQQKSEEELATLREQLTAEHQQAMAEVAQKRQAVERRAEHVGQCQATLKQLRGELGRMHRETLEIRLATEELWVQLAGSRRRRPSRDRLAGSGVNWPSSIIKRSRSWPNKKGIGGDPQPTARSARHVGSAKAAIRAMGHRSPGRASAAGFSAGGAEQHLHREELQHVQQSQGWQTERMKCRPGTAPVARGTRLARRSFDAHVGMPARRRSRLLARRVAQRRGRAVVLLLPLLSGSDGGHRDLHAGLNFSGAEVRLARAVGMTEPLGRQFFPAHAVVQMPSRGLRRPLLDLSGAERLAQFADARRGCKAFQRLDFIRDVGARIVLAVLQTHSGKIRFGPPFRAEHSSCPCRRPCRPCPCHRPCPDFRRP